MSQPEAFEASLPVIRALEELHVDYLVGGSLASSFHGKPRSTADADLVADLKLAHATLLAARLVSDYYVDADQIRQAVRSRSSFNVIYLRTMFKVDVFVMKDEPFAREEMRRRQRISIAGEERIEIASAEDTVLQKILWYRLGGGQSDRQWEDLLGVLKVRRRELDYEYLRRWPRSWRSPISSTGRWRTPGFRRTAKAAQRYSRPTTHAPIC